jgi:hypothetical protein
MTTGIIVIAMILLALIIAGLAKADLRDSM